LNGAFDFVDPIVSTQAIGCGNTCAPRTACVAHAPSDARCNTTGILTTRHVTTGGPLSSGTWVISVIGDDGSTPCTTLVPTELRCTIPARVAGAPARTYAITATLDDVSNLKPAFGTYAEHTAGGFTYTGLPPTTVFRCNQLINSLPDANGAIAQTCVEWTQYTGITAIAGAILSLAATTMNVNAGIDASSLQPINYVVDPIAVPSVTWFGGRSGLP
jgi:hypothetical protein